MAGTYSQIYIQVVFAVKGRQNLLQKEWRHEVFKYMSGIINNKGQNRSLSTASLTTFMLLSDSNRPWRYLTLFEM